MARNANILFPPYSEMQRSFAAQNDSGITRISDTFHSVKLDSNFIASIFNSKLLYKAEKWQKKKIEKLLFKIDTTQNKTEIDSTPIPVRTQVKLYLGGALVFIGLALLVFHLSGGLVALALIAGLYLLIKGSNDKYNIDHINEEPDKNRKRDFKSSYKTEKQVGIVIGMILLFLGLVFGYVGILLAFMVPLGLLFALYAWAFAMICFILLLLLFRYCDKTKLFEKTSSRV